MTYRSVVQQTTWLLWACCKWLMLLAVKHGEIMYFHSALSSFLGANKELTLR